MLHALTATIGTLAVIASIKMKLAYFRSAQTDAGVAPPAAQPASPHGH